MLGDQSVSRPLSKPLITPPIKSFLERSMGPGFRLMEIAGDASTRRFYRITRGRKTAVLMVHPERLTPSSPLFSNHRVLASIGAPVPRILESDPPHGLVLVEDAIAGIHDGERIADGQEDTFDLRPFGCGQRQGFFRAPPDS